ncbi:MAG: glycosyltransferase N-terminal domain-containing protein [Bacteroidia bacterium]|nr:glycosyltransferase N-terminal domain-containing protein [Bacteroidia bacterium]
MLALRALYHLLIWLMGAGLRIAAGFHARARLLIAGRAQTWDRLATALATDKRPRIWVHCASLGEFEQARNLIDAMAGLPSPPAIVVTFFSPSGYTIRHQYKHAAVVAYLPLDTTAHAHRLVELIQPRAMMLIRYELWLNLLRVLHQRQIPLILVAARIRAGSPFLRGMLAPLYREALRQMAHIFTQDTDTARLLSDAGCSRISVSGDTRFDRVLANTALDTDLPGIRTFISDRLCIIGGSVWKPETDLLLSAWEQLGAQLPICLILAPHEIHPEDIDRQIARFPDVAIRYTAISHLSPAHRILWIDNIGMLSRLYAHADVAVVGGGWGSGLHNILEPAVFGKPVIWGPKYERFPEAAELIRLGGGFSVRNTAEGVHCLQQILTKPELRDQINRTNKTWIQNGAGATEHILSWCRTQQWF